LLAADGPEDLRVAHNAVHHDAAHPSYLVLPIAFIPSPPQ
jgi:hypothetical protein